MSERIRRLRCAVPIALILVAVLSGCGPATREPAVRDLDSPAPPGSRVPNLTERDGLVYLSWIEESSAADGSARLRFSVREGDRWSEPQTIVEDSRLFVNWADFPVVRAGEAGTLVAAWPALPRRGSIGYVLRFSVSADGGATWSAPLSPHEDDSATEHGFISVVPGADGTFDVVWLDGREMVSPAGSMRLMANRWDGTRFLGENVLDTDVCTCCQTDATRTPDGLLVAYRDHTEGEIRDISLVGRLNESWEEPRSLHADGWLVAGCPVNGPALHADGARVAVAWFTAAGDEPRVLVAQSVDGGRRFGAAQRIDGGDPLGRVSVRWLADGALAVSWLEKVEHAAEVRVRRVEPDSGPGSAVVVGVTEAARTSGFPRLARQDGRLIVAWTVRRGAVMEIRLSEVIF